MKFYLITRPESPRYGDAIARLTKSLNGLNHQIELVPAVFPVLGDSHDFHQDLFRQRYGRAARLGEIGCLCSHKLAARAVAQNAEPWGVVLEDDFEFTEDACHFFSRDLVFEPGPTILLLGHSRTVPRNLWVQRLKEPLQNRRRLNGCEFGQNSRVNRCGTVGYMINRSAAKTFSELPNYFVADDFQILQNVGIAVLHPARPLVYEQAQSASTVGNVPEVRHDLFSPNFIRELGVITKEVLKRWV